MYIFAGTYERFLLGYNVPDFKDAAEPVVLEKKYTFAAHKSTVKCVAAAGPYVASGGSDDLIHLYDLQNDKDCGFLMNPGDGAIPCLQFFTPKVGGRPSHLFSGSADGSICIWKVGGDWDALKLMKGHKASVNSIAVHPSGRLALSTARDSAIRMWNLVKGRCTYTAKLDIEGDEVKFSPSGDAYALVCGSKVTVHSTSGEGGLLASLDHGRRVLCSTAVSDDVLLTGVEDGSIRVWDVRSNSCVRSWEKAHSSRVRAMAVVKQGTGQVPEQLATASSDGVVRLWDTRMLGERSGAPPALLAEAASRARITALCCVDPSTVPKTSTTAASGGKAAAKPAAGSKEVQAKKQQQPPAQAAKKPVTQQAQQQSGKVSQQAGKRKAMEEHEFEDDSDDDEQQQEEGQAGSDDDSGSGSGDEDSKLDEVAEAHMREMILGHKSAATQLSKQQQAKSSVAGRPGGGVQQGKQPKLGGKGKAVAQLSKVPAGNTKKSGSAHQSPRGSKPAQQQRKKVKPGK